MKLIGITVSSLCAVIVLAVPTCAKEWRGIIPMKSTCEDVKRVLGVATCDPPDGTYDLGSEKVRISFSKSPCAEAFGKFWDVPVGTVLSIWRRVEVPIAIDQLGVDLSNYKITPTDVVGLDEYRNDEEGIWFEGFAGTAQNIFYTPAKRDDRLQCKSEKLKPAKAKGRGKW